MMPGEFDFVQKRKPRYFGSRSRRVPLPLWPEGHGGSAAPATGRVRLATARAFLLLLISATTLTRSLAQSPAAGAEQVRDLLEHAQAALKSNAVETARKEFQAVLALDPKNAEANANLGVIAFVQRDYSQAAEYLRSALATDPSLVKSQALLGICERRLGNRSAQTLLEKSFPRLQDKKLRIQVGMELAGIYEQQGDLERTASVMQALVDLDPDNVEILYGAQRVYSDLADDTLNKLAMLAPGSAQMQKVIAERLVNGGDLKGAAEHYRKALEINPNLPGLHFELGEALWQGTPKDPEAQAAAEKEFAAAIQMEGASAAVECELGAMALLRSDMGSARAHFQRALALDSANPEAQLGLGKVLMTAGNPQEAVKYLRMAAQADPLNTEAHYRLGMAYKELKMADESRHELQLFQEIRDAKDRVRQLYRQMNKPSRALDEQLSGIEP